MKDSDANKTIDRLFDCVANNKEIDHQDVADLCRAYQSMQDIASYLADCHAATMKSVSKSESKTNLTRLKAIGTVAHSSLKHGVYTNTHKPRGILDVVQRLASGLGSVESALRKKEAPKPKN